MPLTCYTDAQKKIDESQYDFILLDHNLPRTSVENSEETNSGELIRIESIGYTLIPSIKERWSETVILGTSSSSASELKGMPKPDYVLEKGYTIEAGEFKNSTKIGLEKILSERNAK